MPVIATAKEYAEMVSNPKTPYEWQLALSDPHPPVYKLMMAVAAEESIKYSILCEVIDRWVHIQEQKREAELMQMHADSRAYEHATQERFAAEAMAANQIVIPTEKIVLETFIQNCNDTITILTSSITETKKELDNVNTNIAALDASWNEKQDKQAQAYCEELKKKLDDKGCLRVKVGEEELVCEIADDKLEKIKAACHVPSPSKVLELNPKILRKKANEKDIERAKLVIGGANEFRQELAIKATAFGLDDGDNLKPSAFLKAAKAFASLLPTPGNSPVDKDEKEKAIAEAVVCKFKQRVAERKLREEEQKLAVAEQVRDIAVDRLAAITARPRLLATKPKEPNQG